jgi:hypothetical protein
MKNIILIFLLISSFANAQRITYDKGSLTGSQIYELTLFAGKNYVLKNNEIVTDSRFSNINEIISLLDFCQITDFEIWLEIPTAQLNNDILSGLSWSTYTSENDSIIHRKWEDMQLLKYSIDSTQSIRYLQGITSDIQKDDLIFLKDYYPGRKFDKARLIKVLHDSTDIYYQEIP